MLREALDGLEYLHRMNVAHGDIHRGNVLIDCEYHVYLADFGLSNLADLTPSSMGIMSRNAGQYTPERKHYTEFDRSEHHGPTKEEDIFAFATMVWSFFRPEPKHPFDEYTQLSKIKLKELPLFNKEKAFPMPDWALVEIDKCWKWQPSERPSAGEIFPRLPGPLQRSVLRQ
ncbi:hypothetical protein NLI96_g3649 [Meripilus lineatus]|uniref:Protein kinase domain-containing protein n=1 Tax=Meripilus lineatus TaxID=2056292 RepID=A0AAD5YKW1_9APHY|nr:hypothetical protein NLI96_g3649 [Physisporinus lineatus]